MGLNDLIRKLENIRNRARETKSDQTDDALTRFLEDLYALKNWTPPPPEQREDGLECLAYHRGKWRHVRWVRSQHMWILGYGGPFIRDGERSFAPLPPRKAGEKGDFYDYRD